MPRTGSIGKAFVQEYNCSIDDNCLVLIPLENFKYSIIDLYFVSGIIRLNSWISNMVDKLLQIESVDLR